VVIPNYEGKAHLEYSIPSFLNGTYIKTYIVVVDGSTDGSLEFLNKNYPNVHTIDHLLENTFASKVNAGIKYAINNGADYVAVCNNDILVLPNWVEYAIDAFQKVPNSGVVGNIAMYRYEKDAFMKINHENIEYIYHEVDSVNGACYMCDINIFKTMGFFDESYHMYAEETDLFLRIRKAGYKIIQTNIHYWHYGEGSEWGGDPVLYVSWINYRNALRCAIKNDTIFNQLRMFLSISNQACNPFLSKNKIKKISKRMRPYNVVFNGFILFYSVLWNILRLPLTLSERIAINNKAKRTRQDRVQPVSRAHLLSKKPKI